MIAFLGKYVQVKFLQYDGDIRTIRSNKNIDKNKENSYFEIEIEEIKNEETNIIIGFSNKTGYNPTILPGESNGSVGFHSNGGLIKVSLKPNFEYGIVAKFGETLG